MGVLVIEQTEAPPTQTHRQPPVDVSGAGMWQGVHAVRTLEGTHDYAHRTATICLPYSRFVSVSVVKMTVDYDDMKHI